jgi:hypothetical protein
MQNAKCRRSLRGGDFVTKIEKPAAEFATLAELDRRLDLPGSDDCS